MDKNPYAPPTASADTILEAQASTQIGDRLPRVLLGIQRALLMTFVGSVVATFCEIVGQVVVQTKELESGAALAHAVGGTAFSVGWACFFVHLFVVVRRTRTAIANETLDALLRQCTLFLIYDVIATVMTSGLGSLDGGALAALAVGGATLWSVEADTVSRLRRWLVISIVSTLGILALATVDVYVSKVDQGRTFTFFMQTAVVAVVIVATARWAAAASAYNRAPGQAALLSLFSRIRGYWLVLAVMHVIMGLLGLLNVVPLLLTG